MCSTSSVIRDCILKPQWANIEYSLEWIKLKSPISPNVGEDMESPEHSFIVGGYVKWFNYFGKQSGSLLRIQLLNDAAILLVGIYPRKMKNMCTKTLTLKCSYNVFHNK